MSKTKIRAYLAIGRDKDGGIHWYVCGDSDDAEGPCSTAIECLNPGVDTYEVREIVAEVEDPEPIQAEVK